MAEPDARSSRALTDEVNRPSDDHLDPPDEALDEQTAAETVDAHGEETVPGHTPETGERPGDTERLSQPRSPRLVATVSTLVVLALALASGVVLLGAQVWQHRAEDARRIAVLQAARQGVVNLTTLSHETADRDIQRLLDGATGTFAEQFGSRADGFTEIVRQAQVVSTGEVLEIGVERIEENAARVLVAARAQVRNTAAQQTQERNYRLTVDLQAVDDRWLVSNVEFVP